MKEFTWKYTDIQEVVMRTRHEHVDIRFNPPLERFRLMSSYNQLLVNELVLRGKEHSHVVPVSFELGTKSFAYDDPSLSKLPLVNSRGSQFGRREAQIKVSELLSNDASQQTKDDLDETDRHLDALSDVLTNINNMQLTANTEINRQNTQLDIIDTKTDKVQGLMANQSDRMTKLMK